MGVKGNLVFNGKSCRISNVRMTVLSQKSLFVLFPFLDASSHLYKRVCPSVCRSVRPSVRPSVRRSVRNQLFSKLKNGAFSS